MSGWRNGRRTAQQVLRLVGAEQEMALIGSNPIPDTLPDRTTNLMYLAATVRL